MKTLLKNGLIVDGSGKEPYIGNVVIQDNMILDVFSQEIELFDGNVVDCTGKCIAPGFIDAHSHNDWFAAISDPLEKFEPFVAQGITTQVVGNCGFSPAGFEKDTPYRNLIGGGLFNIGDAKGDFADFDGWYDAVKGRTPVNLVPLIGHGTARIGISGNDARILSPNELQRLNVTMKQAMEQGVFGASLGIMYMPARFSNDEEFEMVAKTVKEYEGMLTIHGRALSSISTSYPISMNGKAHNVLALEEMSQLALKTGVNMEYSHLIFVGEASFGTVDESMSIIEKTAERTPFGFDIYSTTCGASVISIIMPNWYFELTPQQLKDPDVLKRLSMEIELSMQAVGFGFENVCISWCGDQFTDIQGMSVTEIAKKWGCTPFEAYLRLVEYSGGDGQAILYKYSNEEIVSRLSRHPLSIYMTDAWVESKGKQNPATFGAFPRFLRNSRQGTGADLAVTVRKMTGLTADRFGIQKRGYLKKGFQADICVFDYKTVQDYDHKPPVGICHVYINGNRVMSQGKIDRSVLLGAGQALRK
jgi:N-acyl-D-amino-acid deacylase